MPRNLVIVISTVSIFMLVCVWSGGTEGIEIKSGEVIWKFDSEQGGLVSLTYGDGKHMVRFSSEQLWMFVSSQDSTNTISIKDASEFKYYTVNKSVIFEWKGSRGGERADTPSEWIVNVRWSEENNFTICGEISADGIDAKYNELIFPVVAGVPQGKIVVPYWMGEIFDPQAFPGCSEYFGGSRRWEYPGTLSMQWFGVALPDELGVMLWAMDNQCYLKKAELIGIKDSLKFQWRHYLSSNEHNGSRRLPYKLCLSAVKGGWFEMCQTYKFWALTQPWVIESRRSQRLIPEWVLKTAIWVWNRGTSDRVLSPAIHLSERTNLPVSVLWHWWHNCAYDVGFPEYLPPREGMDSFSNAIRKAYENNVNAIVYVNQRLWGMNTKSWSEKEAEKFAVKTKSGEIMREVYNPFVNTPCVPMCMGTEFWRKTLLDIMLPLLQDTYISGFYLDQACASLPCFATNHGHPPGAGNYWINGFRSLVVELRKANSVIRENDLSRLNKGIALAGEGCGEAWLPLLDLLLSLQVSKGRYTGADGWRPVPLFQAVYHPIAVQFGNYASLTEPPYDPLWGEEYKPTEELKLLDERWNLQFRYEQASAWAWGQQLCIANYKPELWQLREKEMNFLLSLVTLRQKFLKYFQDGTMLKPLPETNKDEWDEICLSVYACRKEGGIPYKKRGSLVVSTPWQAFDGSVALAVANVDEKPRTFRFVIPLYDWQLPIKGRVFKTTVSVSVEVATYDWSSPLCGLNLSGLEACVLEFQKLEPARGDKL